MSKSRFEYRITLIYLAIGLLWIILSDLILSNLVLDENALSFFQSIKGSFYVLVTAILLFIFVRNYVHKQEATEQELWQSKERYKAMYENAPLAFQSLDADGYFLDINPQWLSILGYSREEVIGKWFGDFVHPEEKEGFKSRFRKFAEEGCVTGVEFRMKRKDGSYVYVLYEGAAETENGKILRTYCTFKDISGERMARAALKEREADLMQALEKAEESDKLKSAFLANISHEIRTPMNGIMGFSEILEKPGLKNEEQERATDFIRKSGERLLATIDNIIEVSQLESGQIKVNESTVKIDDTISFLARMYSKEADKKGLEFRVEKPDCDIIPQVKTDKQKLETILSSILENAIKFTERGFVELGCRCRDNGISLYIKDSGVGIPEERREAIFERFVQGETDLSRPYEGSGLGLSIARAYADLIGLRISLDSTPGKGSTFTVNIPEKCLAKNEPATAEPLIRKFKPGKEKVVIIAEDDETSFQYLEILLSGENLRIIRAMDGIEAIEACEEYPEAALILMDLKMPKLDGFEATRKIRKNGKKVPVIAQTAYAMSGDRQRALDCGCNDYISKPINGAELIHKVRLQLQQT